MVNANWVSVRFSVGVRARVRVSVGVSVSVRVRVSVRLGLGLGLGLRLGLGFMGRVAQGTSKKRTLVQRLRPQLGTTLRPLICIHDLIGCRFE
jgi:hypothetical protein